MRGGLVVKPDVVDFPEGLTEIGAAVLDVGFSRGNKMPMSMPEVWWMLRGKRTNIGTSNTR